MAGQFVDNNYFSMVRKNLPLNKGIYSLDTDFGVIRMFDTKENKPIIINVPKKVESRKRLSTCEKLA